MQVEAGVGVCQVLTGDLADPLEPVAQRGPVTRSGVPVPSCTRSAGSASWWERTNSAGRRQGPPTPIRHRLSVSSASIDDDDPVRPFEVVAQCSGPYQGDVAGQVTRRHDRPGTDRSTRTSLRARGRSPAPEMDATRRHGSARPVPDPGPRVLLADEHARRGHPGDGSRPSPAARDHDPPNLRGCGAEYDWGVHALAFGTPLGLADDRLASTEPRPPQILELAVTAGRYHTIASSWAPRGRRRSHGPPDSPTPDDLTARQAGRRVRSGGGPGRGCPRSPRSRSRSRGGSPAGR